MVCNFCVTRVDITQNLSLLQNVALYRLYRILVTHCAAFLAQQQANMLSTISAMPLIRLTNIL